MALKMVVSLLTRAVHYGWLGPFNSTHLWLNWLFQVQTVWFSLSEKINYLAATLAN